jgi:hypothetical protein
MFDWPSPPQCVPKQAMIMVRAKTRADVGRGAHEAGFMEFRVQATALRRAMATWSRLLERMRGQASSGDRVVTAIPPRESLAQRLRR